MTTAVEPVETPCLCAGLRMAMRTISRRYDAALRGSGLKTTQFSVLARLEAEGPATFGHLAARLAMDRSTLSRELRTLERRDLVAVEAGADRRERIVSLTPAGERLRAEAHPHWRAANIELRDELGRDRLRALLGELHDLSRG